MVLNKPFVFWGAVSSIMPLCACFQGDGDPDPRRCRRVSSEHESKSEEPTDAGRGPRGRPLCRSPGPASWSHSGVSQVSRHRTRVVTAGPLCPDPAACLRSELARESSASAASAAGGLPPPRLARCLLPHLRLPDPWTPLTALWWRLPPIWKFTEVKSEASILPAPGVGHTRGCPTAVGG